MRFWFSGPRIMGLRTGVSFGPEDFRRFDPPPGNAGANAQAQVGFVYVVEGDHGWVKVGFSTNPLARLATLRTASPYTLKFAYLGALPLPLMPKVEAEAHGYLHKSRVIGEWFGCKPEMAVAALNAAAHRNGVTLQPVPEHAVKGVLQAAASPAAGAASASAGHWPLRIKTGVICTALWAGWMWFAPSSDPVSLGVGIFFGGLAYYGIGRALARA